MSLQELTDPNAVLEALKEFDRLGRVAFLKAYGFGAHRGYVVVHGGKTYDSKAIAGVAFGYQFPDRGPLKPADFSGGEATVRAKLESLGFHVEGPRSLTRALLMSTLANLNVATLPSGDPAPYKPLLVLVALARLRSGHPRLMPFDEFRNSVTSLPLPRLAGANVPFPEPYWRLQNDGDIWDVVDNSDVPLIDGYPASDPPNLEVLRRSKAGFTEAAHHLLSQPDVLAEAARLIVRTYFRGYERDLLERLGITGDAMDLSNAELEPLSERVEQALEEIATRPPGAPKDLERAGDLKELINERIPAVLQSWVGVDWEVRGSIGMGGLAEVPWVGVFHRSAGPSAQSGYYPVYLFAADGSRVYLSLNVGTERLTGGLAPIRKRALDVRAAAGLPTGLETQIDLSSTNTRPRRYEAANALGIKYVRESIPEDNQLRSDLAQMLELFEQVRHSGLVFQDVEPLHLLFKWNAERDPDTVVKHRKIATELGSVWWGRLGSPTLPGISGDRLADFRRQLEAEVLTHVYLYRRGELWLTKMEQITSDAADVDEERLPSYYNKDECNLFVRISHFRELPADWTTDHLLLASDPDPSGLAGSLSNQQSPLFMFERFEPLLRQQTQMTNVQSRVERDRPPAQPVELTIDWLVEQTGWSEGQLREVIAALLDSTPQVILAGPPGTSKTWVALCLARFLTNDQPLAHKVVQFHPSYGYEEFVEGLRPVVDRGGVDFKRVDGIVLEMANEIAERDETRVLIIDEMNRANLPRVFGELMFLLEYRDNSIRLLYSQNFSLPPRFTIIGTMNTADRSIRSLDIALRRRFDIFECPPDAAVLEHYFQVRTNEVPNLIRGFELLNADLLERLDRHHLIGHTFFMRDPLTATQLRRTWEHQLMPLIEEYFFDQPDLVAEFTMEKYWPSV